MKFLELKKWQRRVDSFCAKNEFVSVGWCEVCDHCPEDEDEGFFSWSPCDVCGSGLGGNRYAGHMLVDGKLCHIDVCVDCVMYIANGDLPEVE